MREKALAMANVKPVTRYDPTIGIALSHIHGFGYQTDASQRTRTP